jgi:hypothetical protein
MAIGAIATSAVTKHPWRMNGASCGSTASAQQAGMLSVTA